MLKAKEKLALGRPSEGHKPGRAGSPAGRILRARPGAPRFRNATGSLGPAQHADTKEILFAPQDGRPSAPQPPTPTPLTPERQAAPQQHQRAHRSGAGRGQVRSAWLKLPAGWRGAGRGGESRGRGIVGAVPIDSAPPTSLAAPGPLWIGELWAPGGSCMASAVAAAHSGTSHSATLLGEHFICGCQADYRDARCRAGDHPTPSIVLGHRATLSYRAGHTGVSKPPGLNAWVKSTPPWLWVFIARCIEIVKQNIYKTEREQNNHSTGEPGVPVSLSLCARRHWRLVAKAPDTGPSPAAPLLPGSAPAAVTDRRQHCVTGPCLMPWAWSRSCVCISHKR